MDKSTNGNPQDKQDKQDETINRPEYRTIERAKKRTQATNDALATLNQQLKQASSVNDMSAYLTAFIDIIRENEQQSMMELVTLYIEEAQLYRNDKQRYLQYKTSHDKRDIQCITFAQWQTMFHTIIEWLNSLHQNVQTTQ